MGTADVVVIGGGVIGLSVAYALAREGATVTVLDAGTPGQASTAAAGMLAPLAEFREPCAFMQMAVESLRRWPSFAAGLREDTETTLEILGPGMLRVARTEAEDRAFRAALAWQGAVGVPQHHLDAAKVYALEPNVGPGVWGALFSPEERYVEPPVLHHALLGACRARGVAVRAGVAVTGFESDGARLTALRTAEGTVAGGTFVIAGGVWSEALGGQLGRALPVHPLRGQIIALGPVSPAPFRHTLFTPGGYLVPRPDGRVVAGATEEHVGFDTENTAAGVEAQVQMARTLVPALADAPTHSAWTGLRPVSADGQPLLGLLPGWDNVHAATGMGRNGILMTAITGDRVAAHLLHGAPLPDEFSPRRFAEAA